MTLDVLLDEGSFSEIGENSGFGTIDGRPVCVYHFKGRFKGCSDDVVELALKTGTPLITVLDCDEFEVSYDALADLSKLLAKMSVASGVVPRISILLGECHWLLGYIAADFVIATKNSRLSVVMPDVIRIVTGKEAEVGGDEHARTENVHFFSESEEDAATLARKLMSYLPLNNMEDPPILETNDDPSRRTERVLDLIPDDVHKPYDVRDVIRDVIDDGDFLEVQPNFAQNVVVGFGSLDGVTVGIVANNPMIYAGCLDLNAVKKITRFVRFCDAFNIPIVTFVDTPGYLPDNEQELSGLPYYATKLVQAYAEATVPLITIVLRKAYGAAYLAMGSKFVGADVVYAYPNAEFAVTDIDTDVRLLHGELSEEERRRRTEEYRSKEANANRALERRHVDAIIDPVWTRSRIINALRMLETKRKKLPPKKHDT